MNDILIQKQQLEKVLASFRIGIEGIDYTQGPSVTLFEIVPEIGVRVSKIKNLKDEIALALRVPAVRIIAPTPNGTIGIEVPVIKREILPMKDMLADSADDGLSLPLVLGKTINGRQFVADLATMPHLLVAGATGMGKSVCLNVVLASLLAKRTPDELKLVLIDPKQVELSVYNDIAKPYIAKLQGSEDGVITEYDDAMSALNAVIRLMESRYTMLKEARARNIQEYNERAAEKIPYYVVVIDEFGDLMLQSSGREMENAICRIAQKARAVGIHMVLATQRPDTKIVTGTIKANFPTRIAFRTVTGTDSRVILDRMGAEKLLGKGDMLYFDGGDTTRIQCAFFSTDEVVKMCAEIKRQYENAEQAYLPAEPKASVAVAQPIDYIYLPSDLYGQYCAYNFSKLYGQVLLQPEHLGALDYTKVKQMEMLEALGIIDGDLDIIINDEESIKDIVSRVRLAQ